jgi:hypothetical protein
MRLVGSNRIGRRATLRGLLAGGAVSVGLPPLEAMLDAHGTAYADGTEIPKRFGVWFWGNGVNTKFWAPATTGRGYAPSPSLKPLADAGVLDAVSIATNTYAPTKGYWAHHTSYKTLFAAAAPIYEKPNFEGFPYKFGGPRFDDVIREKVGGKTRVNGASVRVSRSPGNVSYLSGDVRSSRYNPQALYDELFGGFVPGASSTVAPSTWVVGMRRSVLDAVRADTNDLRARLPAGDRARLDAHLEGIRRAEAGLAQVGAAKPTVCSVPARAEPRPADMAGRQEPLTGVSKAFSDLLRYALACDITRTFDFVFTGVQNDAVLWEAGLSQGHHELGHNEAGDQPLIQKSVVYIMERLAYFLAQLKAVPVGAGTLLDHCCILGTSEQDSPRGHSTFNMPSLVIGRAGGALRSGVHFQAVPSSSQRSDPKALHTRVLLTVMRAMGLPQEKFGVGPNETSASIAELEA